MDLATPFDFTSAGCSREARDLRFSYFSSKEIRNISVAEITTEETFTALGIALPGGLHAPALGTIDRGGLSCPTCSLDEDCPGHMGHIELAAPVYNPFLFIDLLKLMRKCCLNCYRLKTHAAQTERTVMELNRLDPASCSQSILSHGPLTDMKTSKLMSDLTADPAAALIWQDLTGGNPGKLYTEALPARAVKQVSECAKQLKLGCDDATRLAEAAEAERGATSRDFSKYTEKTTSAIYLMRSLVASYGRDVPLKCANCGSKSPKWRKDGYSKIFVKQASSDVDMFCMPAYVRKVLRKVWENEEAILRWLIPGARECRAEIYFFDTILVPPSRFRPCRGGGKDVILAPQTAHLRVILQSNVAMREALLRDNDEADVLPVLPGGVKRKPKLSAVDAFQALQIAVNGFMDSAKGEKNEKLAEGGIRQLLEKKEGLFRMKMMGKRVNYAARSVISPDPNVETTEIGVPIMIARELTYPEVATAHNVQELRRLVLRGNDYPGAAEVHIPNTNGSKKVRCLGTMDLAKREALGKMLITNIETGQPPITVMRHLRNGDPLLVNRQPTLHKPGIMAHMAKVLKQQNTIRMHYANCNTYNADFDGDEMNLHAPQDPLGRIEAISIAKADKQFLVPTSGRPLRGLIQDHVIAGTMLSKRDTFYTRSEVSLLMYAGLRAAFESGDLPTDWDTDFNADDVWICPDDGCRACNATEDELCKRCGAEVPMWVCSICQQESGGSDAACKNVFDGKSCVGVRHGSVETEQSRDEKLLLSVQQSRPWFKAKLKPHAQRIPFKFDPPCIMKPQRLWSGKQVFSMLLKNLLDLFGKSGSKTSKASSDTGLNHTNKAKTQGDIWNGKLDGDKEENNVLFKDTELLSGVLDKSSFGAADHGLTHLIFELFGAAAVGSVLSSFVRLFTVFLQLRGFTCAFDDLLLRGDIEAERKVMVLGSRIVGANLINEWLGKNNVAVERNDESFAKDLSNAGRALMQSDLSTADGLEALYLGNMRKSGGKIIDACIPAGQKHPVPNNSFSAMVQTGAKGSKVNHSMCSCLLGQQELEGRQVPMMTTRRSLPCFAPFDMAIRTRGYVTDRYLTGVRPQEFFFHCMAGREGLVDTAVKTSRSGYLQRCLVKHLEGLKVCYDLTVRDGDGSVVQFLYGEDGVDVTRASHLFKFDVMRSNYALLKGAGKKNLNQLSGSSQSINMGSSGNFFEAQRALAEDKFTEAYSLLKPLTASPDLDAMSTSHLKSFRDGLKQHSRDSQVRKPTLDPVTAVMSPARFFGATSEKHEAELQRHLADTEGADGEKFANFMRLKFLQCLAEPGEAVGVIAAQSMGEPSTQMTLNTFHLAGHGGANVTLGIPRLREIVQTASKKISTPLMYVPVVADEAGKTELEDRRRFANRLCTRFRKVTLLDCMKKVSVKERTRLIGGQAVRRYHIHFEFWDLEDLCKSVPHLSREKLQAYMKQTFLIKLKNEVKKLMLIAKESAPKAVKAPRDQEDGEGAATVAADGEEDEGAGGGDGDGPATKKRRMNRKQAENTEDVEAAEAQIEAEGNEEQDDDDASGMYTDDDKDGMEVDAGEESGNDDEKAPAEKKAAGAEDEEQLLLLEEEQLFAEGEKSEQLVMAGDLIKDSMRVQVNVKFSECAQKLLVGDVIRDLCARLELQDPATAGVNKVSVEEKDEEVWLTFEGINLRAVQHLPECTIDSRRIRSNSTVDILETFGVEAARQNIVNEIRGVFGHYGIEVNYRHLYLISDHMTQGGGYKAFNRTGMYQNASPLLQMSYETTMQFLTMACTENVKDHMASPASSIVVGQVPKVGTGMVTLLCDLGTQGAKTQKRAFTF